MYDKNVLFLNSNIKQAEIDAKKYIIELSKQGKKIVLLDSFWSKEKYSRFISSPYKSNIEKRYHIKISVEDFLQKDNLVDYMNRKDINIVKIKSIVGFMSAAELFPVIISKLNTIESDESIHVLVNDYILDNLEWSQIKDAIHSVDKNKIKFIILSSKDEIGKEIVEKYESIINN